MMRMPNFVLALTMLACAPCVSLAQETEVDLELVLAVDVSRSMDPGEQDLQKQGYMAALQHPEVLAAIRSGFLGRIAVTYVEWAGPGLAGDDRAVDADRWAKPPPRLSPTALPTGPISYLHGTSISGALAFAAGLFDDKRFRATRQVIDVSGDGPNNMGAPVLAVRETVLAQGITINGLPIMIGGGLRRLQHPRARHLLRGLRDRRAGRLPAHGAEHRPHRRSDPPQAGAGDRRRAGPHRAGRGSSWSRSRASIA